MGLDLNQSCTTGLWGLPDLPSGFVGKTCTGFLMLTMFDGIMRVIPESASLSQAWKSGPKLQYLDSRCRDAQTH